MSRCISYSRGWEIFWHNGGWIYSDTLRPYNPMRPCKRCGKSPTRENHDACLGHIQGVKNACCGHGVTKPYVMMEKHNDE